MHPSPHRDGGYGVSDYYGIVARFGSLGDFAELLDHADEQGLRIVLDLVVNHTSTIPYADAFALAAGLALARFG